MGRGFYYWPIIKMFVPGQDSIFGLSMIKLYRLALVDCVIIDVQ